MKLLHLWALVLVVTVTVLSSCSKGPERVTIAPEDAVNKHAQLWDEKHKSALRALEQNDLVKADAELVASLAEAEACAPNDPRIAVSLTDLASVYEKKGLYSEAGNYLRKSRELFGHAYGKENSLVFLTMHSEARVAAKQNNYSKAVDQYEEAIKGMERLHDPQQVADLAAAKKEFEEAKQQAAKHVKVEQKTQAKADSGLKVEQKTNAKPDSGDKVEHKTNAKANVGAKVVHKTNAKADAPAKVVHKVNANAKVVHKPNAHVKHKAKVGHKAK